MSIESMEDLINRAERLQAIRGKVLGFSEKLGTAEGPASLEYLKLILC